LENPRSQSRCPARLVRRPRLGLAQATQHKVLGREYRTRLISRSSSQSVAEGHLTPWHVPEKGLLGLVGKNRPRFDAHHGGVCFRLTVAQGCGTTYRTTCQARFIPVSRHAATEIFISPFVSDLSGADGLSRYSAFNDRARGLVVKKHDGSLNADTEPAGHGARSSHQMGEKATAMMWRIKQLADPHGFWAPDVIRTRIPTFTWKI